MRPPCCPECQAERWRLYYVWRRREAGWIDGRRALLVDEAWACSSCYRRGPWRLATAPVLAAVTGHSETGSPATPADPVIRGPSQGESREAIRALFADLAVEDVDPLEAYL